MASQAHAHAPSTSAPVRPINFAPVDLVRTDAPDGTISLRAKVPLAPYEPSLVRVFRAICDQPLD